MWAQAIKDQIEKGDVSFSIVRVVTDAAVVAVQKPARFFIPIVAVSNLLRTAALALEITARSDLLANLHWVASAPLSLCLGPDLNSPTAGCCMQAHLKGALSAGQHVQLSLPPCAGRRTGMLSGCTAGSSCLV